MLRPKQLFSRTESFIYMFVVFSYIFVVMITVFSVSILTRNRYVVVFNVTSAAVGSKRGLVVGRWACSPDVTGSNPAPCY